MNEQSGGDIMTSGDLSDAIAAQSVGGGGGNGGAAGGLIGIGGMGGSSGSGSTVTVDNAATLMTTGETADGIFAESVGGGGGNGGGTALAVIAIGGSGGSSGNGGDVVVDNAASGIIDVTGDQSDGVFAQSVGGGGGQGGSNGSSDVDLGLFRFRRMSPWAAVAGPAVPRAMAAR